MSSSGANKKILQYLCYDLELSTDGSKSELYSRLKEWADDPDKTMTQDNTVDPPTKKLAREVLGSVVMNNVWQDMPQTQLPSWIQCAPLNWGTKKHGKLSSSQWRVICLIHLVVTLVRLWGPLPPDDRRRKLLDNFMDLVKAVTLANLRAIDQHHLDEYRVTIHHYMAGYKELYKDTKVFPVQHEAMHYDETLTRFGPGQGLNAGYYERHIGKLQNQNFNNTFGELEATMLKKSCWESNLRTLLLEDEVIYQHASELIEKFKKYCSEDLRGTRLAFMAHVQRPTADTAYDPSSQSEVLLSSEILG
ncbi:hypothetical protein OF83DRAFT_1175809 [Amylostereum chailletii]|nr:hypothetical protein OF83DRAFT_1175809 [Amylostereum chailletii]